MQSGQSQNQLQKFIVSMAGYYYRFVQDLSRIAGPLTKLSRKGVEYEQSADCEEAFKELKLKEW